MRVKRGSGLMSMCLRRRNVSIPMDLSREFATMLNFVSSVLTLLGSRKTLEEVR